MFLLICFFFVYFLHFLYMRVYLLIHLLYIASVDTPPTRPPPNGYNSDQAAQAQSDSEGHENQLLFAGFGF